MRSIAYISVQGAWIKVCSLSKVQAVYATKCLQSNTLKFFKRKKNQ